MGVWLLDEAKNYINNTGITKENLRLKNLYSFGVAADDPGVSKDNATVSKVAKPALGFPPNTNPYVTKVLTGAAKGNGYAWWKIKGVSNATITVAFRAMPTEDMTQELAPIIMLYCRDASNNTIKSIEYQCLNKLTLGSSQVFKLEGFQVPPGTDSFSTGLKVMSSSYGFYIAEVMVVEVPSLSVYEIDKLRAAAELDVVRSDINLVKSVVTSPNLFAEQDPLAASSYSSDGATCQNVATPAGFRTNKSQVMKATFTDAKGYGYWWLRPALWKNYHTVLSFSVEAMLVPDSVVKDNVMLDMIINCYNSSGQQIYSLTKTANTVLAVDKSTRIHITNISIPDPANTAYIRIGWGIWSRPRPVSVYLADFSLMNADAQFPYTAPSVIGASGGTMDIISPPKIYAVSNDLNATDPYNRAIAASVYLDHCLNLPSLGLNVYFKNEDRDKVSFAAQVSQGYDYAVTFNNGQDVHTESKLVNIDGEMGTNAFTVSRISTKASKGKSAHPKVLVIGDSITNGQCADVVMSGSNPFSGPPYWAHVKELFEMDRIDAGNNETDFNISFLGTANKRNKTITYKNVTRNYIANAEGRGGWSAFTYLRHATVIKPDQQSWDLLGLGNGSHTDYTGTAAQKELFAHTCEVFTGTPSNPFFDNSKTGTNRFSIAKWLAAFRTADDVTGQKYALGHASLGSRITSQEALDNNMVCTPTHVIIAFGTNDLGYVSVASFIADIQEMIAAVRADLPNAFIGVILNPDRPGTLFPQYYPEVRNAGITVSSHNEVHAAVKSVMSAFASVDEVTQKTFILPTYFVAPTAYGYPLREVHYPENRLGGAHNHKALLYEPFGIAYGTHPGAYAHAAWGYQLYSWLKYTMTL